MAVIYLKHPRHGTKVAISEQEALHDIKHGWERDVPDDQVHNFMASIAPQVTSDNSQRTNQRVAPPAGSPRRG